MNPNKRIVLTKGQTFMKFIVQEEDAEEYDEEYQLEDFSFDLSDYMNPYDLPNNSYE